MPSLLEKLRRLCSNCIFAPQNRNATEEELRPYCDNCSLKWEAAVEIERLSHELGITSQNYVHACEQIELKNKVLEEIRGKWREIKDGFVLEG